MLPKRLIQAKHARTLIPFIGAGLSQGLSGNFPSWADLPRRLLDECDEHTVWDSESDRTTLRSRFLEPDPTDPSLERPRLMVLQDMLVGLDSIKAKLRTHYADALSAIFRPDVAAPGPVHAAIAALDTQIVLTTNIDQLLEETPRDRQVYTWKQSAQALADFQRKRKVLFKVHGSAEDYKSVVLTHNEYNDVQGDPAYRLVVNQLVGSHSFLFIGYGMSDPQDLDLFLNEHAEILHGPGHFALLKRFIGPSGLPDDAQELDRTEKLRRQNISVIHFNDFDQIVQILEALASA